MACDTCKLEYDPGSIYCVGCPKRENKPEGLKADNGKPPITLLHRDFVEGTALAMAYGAQKYAEHNWCKGIKYRRLIDAAMRHLIAINDGEDIDPESKLPHRYHACASLNMLCGMTVLHPELDDRYKP